MSSVLITILDWEWSYFGKLFDYVHIFKNRTKFCYSATQNSNFLVRLLMIMESLFAKMCLCLLSKPGVY